MTGFSADWLRLREPFDNAARHQAFAAAALLEQIGRWRGQPTDAPLAVIDLACGHGANLRALAPRLGGLQRWRLIDHDAALLAEVPGALAEWACRDSYRFAITEGSGGARHIDISGPEFRAQVVCHRIDLARGLATLDLGDSALVTASALLDLVSATWLRALILKASASHCAMLFGLSVDGRLSWHPSDPSDRKVHRLFRRHQGRDKGFGPALGRFASTFALQQLKMVGYKTLQTQSDWLIDGAQTPRMQLAMVDDVACAALEQDRSAESAVLDWKARRLAGVSGCQLCVGHADIVATPG